MNAPITSRFELRRECPQKLSLVLLAILVGIATLIALVAQSLTDLSIVLIFLAPPLIAVHFLLPRIFSANPLVINEYGIGQFGAFAKWSDITEASIVDVSWFRTVRLMNTYLIIPRVEYVSEIDRGGYEEALIRFGGRDHPLVKLLTLENGPNRKSRRY